MSLAGDKLPAALWNKKVLIKSTIVEFKANQKSVTQYLSKLNGGAKTV